MNCCDRLLVIFCTFAFFQLILRWKRDFSVGVKAWQMFARGDITTVAPRTSQYMTFDKTAVAYGVPMANMKSYGIEPRERSEIFVLLNVNVTAPPMSFHRATLSINDKDIKQITFMSSIRGDAHVSLLAPIIMIPSFDIKFKYYYDDAWNNPGNSSVTFHLTVRSGIINLRDVPWKELYKQDKV